MVYFYTIEWRWYVIVGETGDSLYKTCCLQLRLIINRYDVNSDSWQMKSQREGFLCSYGQSLVSLPLPSQYIHKMWCNNKGKLIIRKPIDWCETTLSISFLIRSSSCRTVPSWLLLRQPIFRWGRYYKKLIRWCILLSVIFYFADMGEFFFFFSFDDIQLYKQNIN